MQYAPAHAPFAPSEGLIATQPIIPKVPEQKIVPKNYEHLEIKDSINYGDL